MPHLAPELGLTTRVSGELGSTREELDGLLDLVSAASELTGPAQPGDSFVTKPSEVARFPGPGEIRILRANRLGVVVREERGVLVLCPVRRREPVRERSV